MNLNKLSDKVQEALVAAAQFDKLAGANTEIECGDDISWFSIRIHYGSSEKWGAVYSHDIDTIDEIKPFFDTLIAGAAIAKSIEI